MTTLARCTQRKRQPGGSRWRFKMQPCRTTSPLCKAQYLYSVSNVFFKNDVATPHIFQGAFCQSPAQRLGRRLATSG